VDFITTREWLAEQDLTPVPHFMTIPTGFGELSSAHVAWLRMNRVVARIEAAQRYGNRPDVPTIRDFRALLAALSNWSCVAPL
jgi:hypothetical protein